MTATLQLDRATALPGDSVAATWSGIDGPAATDWIGLFKDPAVTADARVDVVFTGGAASGTIALRIPSSPASATYYARLFPHNTWSPLASAVVTVGGGAAGGTGGGTGTGAGGGTAPGAGTGSPVAPVPGVGGLDVQALLKNPVVLVVVGVWAASQLGLIGGRRR